MTRRKVRAADEPARSIARAKVRENIARLSARSDALLADVLREMEAARARLVAMLAEGTEFDQARASEMIRAVDAEIRAMRDRMARPVREAYRGAAALGDEDMAAQGRDILPHADTFRISTGVNPMLVDAATGRSADLVGEISESARSRLNALFRRSATGTSRAADVAMEIGRVLEAEGRPSGVFGTLALQTEKVLRTETHAIYETASQARARQIAESVPWEMWSVWVSVRDDRTRESHLRMNGAAVRVGENFNFGASDPWQMASYESAEADGGELGLACSGPHDSILPAEEAVNCRCTRVLRRGERKK